MDDGLIMTFTGDGILLGLTKRAVRRSSARTDWLQYAKPSTAGVYVVINKVIPEKLLKGYPVMCARYARRRFPFFARHVTSTETTPSD
jgi:hypothetical protein